MEAHDFAINARNMLDYRNFDKCDKLAVLLYYYFN